MILCEIATENQSIAWSIKCQCQLSKSQRRSAMEKSWNLLISNVGHRLQKRGLGLNLFLSSSLCLLRLFCININSVPTQRHTHITRRVFKALFVHGLKSNTTLKIWILNQSDKGCLPKNIIKGAIHFSNTYLQAVLDFMSQYNGKIRWKHCLRQTKTGLYIFVDYRPVCFWLVDQRRD